MAEEQTSNNLPVVLIVEDDPQLRTIFATAFELTGFTVQFAPDGLIAQAKLVELTPEVVMLDLHLPHVSGDLILQQIRADERLVQTKVVLSTADSRLASQLRGHAHMVLLKPVSFKELCDLAASLAPG